MMKNKVLRVDASMRKSESQGRQLADKLIERLGTNSPIELNLRDLADGVPFVNEHWIGANFTDPQQRTPEQRAVLAQSDALVSELKAADTLVIATPIYNFGVPAAFKAWIDQVARARETFRYTDSGPVGLLENKKAYVIVTSGGTKLNSEIDFVSPWLRHVLGFIGIHDVTMIDATGLMMDSESVIKNATQKLSELEV